MEIVIITLTILLGISIFFIFLSIHSEINKAFKQDLLEIKLQN